MIKKLINFIKKPYAFSMISEVVSILVAFLFTVFQSRFLGPEVKGQVATINSMVSLLSLVLGMGISQSYPYFRRNSSNDLLPLYFKIAITYLITLLTLSSLIIIIFEIRIKYSAVLLISPILMYDTIVSEITLIERPNRRNLINIIGNISELILVFIFWLTIKPNIVYGVIILAFKSIIKSIIFTFNWRKRLFKVKTNIYEFTIKIVKFGFFPMLTALLSIMNYRVDVLMLNGKVPYNEIGIYSVGSLLADRIWLVPDALKGVMVSNISKGKDYSEASFVIRISNSLCLLIIIGVLLLGNQFINFVFGPEYNGAYTITLILLLGVFPMINYKIIASYNVVMGRQNVSFILLLISVLLNIILNTLMIPIYGIVGAGISSVFSYLVCSVLFIWYFCKVTGESFKNMLLIKKSDIKLISNFFSKKL